MRKKMLIPALTIISILLSGCNDTALKNEHQVYVNDYEKNTYNYETVVRGDIDPTVSLKLVSSELERRPYFPDHDEMEVDQVYVEKGDLVREGDVLISFKSGDISEQISDYESRMGETQLLIDHYTKLSEIDKSLDYSDDLVTLRQELEVCKLYISELTAKRESYSIKAEGSGMVYQVSQLLSYGTVNSTDNVIVIIYGSGHYNSSTADDYDFKIGDKYTATYSISSYEMELVAIEDGGEDVNGKNIRNLTFRFADSDGVLSESENLNMVIEKQGLKDVLHVPEDSVFEANDKNYVYLLDDLGFRHAVEVEVGSTVDGNTVINSGIQDGDKVVVK